MDEIGGLDSYQKIDANELSLGKTLVENLTTEEFDLGQYSDAYAKELEKLIEAKSRGEKITIEKEEGKPEDTTDLLMVEMVCMARLESLLYSPSPCMVYQSF
jgi:non-homologous end joining protein Ku